MLLTWMNLAQIDCQVEKWLDVLEPGPPASVDPVSPVSSDDSDWGPMVRCTIFDQSSI
jgi:hypothetical protein